MTKKLYVLIMYYADLQLSSTDAHHDIDIVW